MTRRTALLAAALVVSTWSPAAHADPVRTLDGTRTDTDRQVTVAWSMHDAAGLAALRAASGRPGVLAVNTDGAQERSRIRPFLRAQGLELTVVCDPHGTLGTDVRSSDGVEAVRVALAARGAELRIAAAP